MNTPENQPEDTADGTAYPADWQERLASLREKLIRLYQHDQFAIHDHIIEFHDRLKKRYPDFPDYKLYHLVSMSTTKKEPSYFDFPGEDSIEAFIHREYSTLPRASSP